MAVNVKLGVDLGSFNSSIKEARAQIKSFDAALKFAESSFKATGDAEAAMTTKTQALNGKLSAQKNMVQQYSQALQQMINAGVDPMSASYQKLQTQMLNAQAGMMDTQAALNGLDVSQQQAAASADKLTNSVNNIGKKISLEQVIGGINKITDGLENAGRKAVQLGEQIFSAVMDKAKWADDTQTMALMYGIDLDTFLRMQKLVTNGLDTSVDAILNAQSKLAKGIGSGNKNALEALLGIGVDPYINKKRILGTDQYIGDLKDLNALFWEAGRALMAMGNEYDKEAAAQALFGRSWKELVPLFDTKNGGFASLEEYNEALQNVQVSSEEDVSELAKLNDKIGELKGNLDTLSTDILATMAPALNAGADALNGVLSTILEYLQKPEGQEMLTKLGDSISGLFTDLSKVNPEDVVNNFVTVFNKLTSALEFIKNNWSAIVDGIKAIGVAFGALKIGEGVLEGLRLINGFRTLTGAGGGVSTGAAAGLGAKLLATGAGTAITGTAATIGASITPYIGPMAAIPMVLEDQTALFRTLRNGGTWEEAGDAAIKEIEASAKNAAKAWEDWGTQIVEAPKNLAAVVWGWITGKGTAGDWSGENGDDWSVKVKPEAEEGSAEALAEQIGAVTVPVKLSVVGAGIGAIGGGGSGLDPLRQDIFGGMRGFANGIPFVNQTQLAWLHRGERVLTASQNRNYTANSNLYVERMIMNNGQDAEGLAAAMAAQNRRVSAGFGA